jgi:cell wall-associated NlpC family hydrolase
MRALFVSLLVATIPAGGEDPGEKAAGPDLAGLDKEPSAVRKLVTAALDLDKMNLSYKFASADPGLGGMDCSGTVHYLLKRHGIKDTPRQSDEIYRWVWESGRFHAVNGHKTDSWEFAHLQPGDLLFWCGTYEVGDRDPPVSHVMVYLGRTAAGHPLMFGASEGRRYQGKKRNGVGLFDFELPSPSSSSRFLGYGTPPGLRK